MSTSTDLVAANGNNTVGMATDDDALLAALAASDQQTKKKIVIQKTIEDNRPIISGVLVGMNNGTFGQSISVKVDPDSATRGYKWTSGKHTVKSYGGDNVAEVDCDEDTLKIFPIPNQRFAATHAEAPGLAQADKEKFDAFVASEEARRIKCEEEGTEFKPSDTPVVRKWPNGYEILHDGSPFYIKAGDTVNLKVPEDVEMPPINLYSKVRLSFRVSRYAMNSEEPGKAPKLSTGISTNLVCIEVLSSTSDVTLAHKLMQPNPTRAMPLITPALLEEREKVDPTKIKKYDESNEMFLIPRIKDVDDQFKVFKGGCFVQCEPTVGPDSGRKRNRKTGQPEAMCKGMMRIVQYKSQKELLEKKGEHYDGEFVSFDALALLGIDGADMHAAVLETFLRMADYFFNVRVLLLDTHAGPMNRLQSAAQANLANSLRLERTREPELSFADFMQRTQPGNRFYYKFALKSVIADFVAFLSRECLPISIAGIVKLCAAGRVASTLTTMPDKGKEKGFVPEVSTVTVSADKRMHPAYTFLNEMAPAERESLFASSDWKEGKYHCFAVPPVQCTSEAGSDPVYFTLPAAVKSAVDGVRAYFKEHEADPSLVLCDPLLFQDYGSGDFAVVEFAEQKFGLSREDAMRAAGLDPENALRADRHGNLTKLTDEAKEEGHPFIERPQSAMTTFKQMIPIYIVHMPTYLMQVAEADQAIELEREAVAAASMPLDEDAEVKRPIEEISAQAKDAAEESAEQPVKRAKVRVLDEEEPATETQRDGYESDSSNASL